MSILDAIIQGLVQGLTEFLPVSSSGHLTIAQHILGITENNIFLNVLLHLGTLIAVCFFYYKLLWRLILETGTLVKDIFTKKFKWQNRNFNQNLIFMLIIGLFPLFLLFLPIPFTDLKFKDLADILTQDKYLIFVGFSLIATSILLTLGMKANKKTNDIYQKKGLMRNRNDGGRKRFNILDALVVGTVQFIAAIFPGLSRSGSTLSAGEMRGIHKQTALDYTFVLAIPSILAAAVLELKDALDTTAYVEINIVSLIIGVIVSAVTGFFAIILFKWLLKTNKMYIFIIYTALIGLIILIISIIELKNGMNIFTETTF